MVDETKYIGFAVDPATGKRHVLRHLHRESSWEPEVYQYEDGDKLIGGEDGIDNLPAQQLANRTEFLRDLSIKLLGAVKALSRQNKLLLRLVPVQETIGTRISASQPHDGSAWIKPEGIINCPETADIRILQAGGKTLVNPLARILDAKGNIQAVTSAWEPLDAPDVVRAGSAFRIVPQTGPEVENVTIQIADEFGNVTRYSTENGSGGGPAGGDEAISNAEIDAIFGW